ncbi:MAG: DUF6326 family protein [Spirochaetes bacterium]|nr:DUF6326 family protein [Spirochaetota bacterium]
MDSIKKNNKLEVGEKISLLWIVILFSMIFADILSFMLPGSLKEIIDGTVTSFEITQEILLVFALLLEIPIIMIFLSRILKGNINRWANIVAAIITIAFVIGGGSLTLHYIFFAAVEVISMLIIIWLAWKWPKEEL